MSSKLKSSLFSLPKTHHQGRPVRCIMLQAYSILLTEVLGDDAQRAVSTKTASNVGNDEASTSVMMLPPCKGFDPGGSVDRHVIHGVDGHDLVEFVAKEIEARQNGTDNVVVKLVCNQR